MLIYYEVQHFPQTWWSHVEDIDKSSYLTNFHAPREPSEHSFASYTDACVYTSTYYIYASIQTCIHTPVCMHAICIPYMKLAIATILQIPIYHSHIPMHNYGFNIVDTCHTAVLLYSTHTSTCIHIKMQTHMFAYIHTYIHYFWISRFLDILEIKKFQKSTFPAIFRLCMFLGRHVWVLSMYASMSICRLESMAVCLHQVCMSLCMHEYMYVDMYVCMHMNV